MAVFAADLMARYLRAYPDDDVSLLSGPEQSDSLELVRSQSAPSVLRTYDPDVVLIQYAHGMYGADTDALVDVVRQVESPTVVTLHHVGFPADPRAALIPVLTAAADAVVVLSAEAGRRLTEGLGCTTDKVTLIPHGVDLPAVPSSRAEARRALGVPRHGPVLSTFGLLRPAKGIIEALKVVAAARQEFPSMRYVIAGDTHPGDPEGRTGYRRALRDTIAELGLNETVQMIERFLRPDEIDVLLTASDVSLLPYRRLDQTTSGPLLRAAAAGTPFFATPFTHATELSREGAGVVDPLRSPDDAASRLCHLLRDTTTLRHMGRRARVLAERHAWPRVVKSYRDVFCRLLRRLPPLKERS
ncbi:MAG: glycosyltransferase [Egibacteraceae bacterium]